MIRSSIFSTALVTLLVVTGCDRSSTEPEHGEPEQLELFNLDTGSIYAFTEGSGSAQHWDGALPAIPQGTGLEVGLRFLDEDGEEIHLEGEFSANAEILSGGAGILEITSHGDHLDLEGLAPGTVQVAFQLYHGNHSDWDAPGLAVTVTQ
jgi:hypothetical protein